MIAILFGLVLICWGLYEYLKFLKRTFKGIIKDYAKIKKMKKEMEDEFKIEEK